MPLDDTSPITATQSQTIRACLLAIATNAIPLIAIITGKTFDIDIVKQWVDYGVTGAFSALSIYYSVRAIYGRINATQMIAAKPQAQL